MKPFDQKLYDADDNAKDLIVTWLNSWQWKVSVNPDKYGIDLIGFDSYGEPVTIEVEVKHNWKTPKFPFDRVHISGRKAKFIKPGCYFVMLNHARTLALTFNYDDLSAADVIYKDTVYTTREQFFELKAPTPVDIA